MGSITLTQIGTSLALVVGIIGSIEFIFVRFNKVLDKKLEPIYKKFDDVQKTFNSKIDMLDEGQCKNFMSRYLKDCENGEKMDETETERFWEIYDHYTKAKEDGGLGLNSYFHKKVEKLQQEGKL